MKVKLKTGKRMGRKFTLTCHKECPKLEVYAMRAGDKEDDLYEIGGVIGTRAEFRKLFKTAGIL